MDFEWIPGSKIDAKSIKNKSKKNNENFDDILISIFYRFLIGFGSILESPGGEKLMRFLMIFLH